MPKFRDRLALRNSPRTGTLDQFLSSELGKRQPEACLSKTCVCVDTGKQIDTCSVLASTSQRQR